MFLSPKSHSLTHLHIPHTHSRNQTWLAGKCPKQRDEAKGRWEKNIESSYGDFFRPAKELRTEGSSHFIVGYLPLASCKLTVSCWTWPSRNSFSLPIKDGDFPVRYVYSCTRGFFSNHFYGHKSTPLFQIVPPHLLFYSSQGGFLAPRNIHVLNDDRRSCWIDQRLCLQKIEKRNGSGQRILPF